MLTSKQQKAFDIIQNLIKDKQSSPSLSELQTAFLEKGMKAKSKRSIVQYLNVLEEKGYLIRSSEERSIRLIDHQKISDLINIPILGLANAGHPLVFAEENISGFLKISKKILKNLQNIFALEIKGDSMNKAQIEQKHLEDGDYVVIDKSATNFINNDIILAIVDGCATIKKIKKTLLGEVVLCPDSYNPVHQPIYIHASESFFINGKVVNVLKNPKNI